MLVQKRPEEMAVKAKEFGLNSYESKLWVALLGKGAATAGELSDLAGVPRSRCYDVLESLEKKGFIMLKLGKPIKFIAIPPHDVMERVKKRILSDAETQSRLIEELETTPLLAELELLYKNGVSTIDVGSLTASIKGRKNIDSHLEGMLKRARKSISIATSEMGLQRKIPLLKSVLKGKKDVKVMVAAPLKKLGLKEMEQLAALCTAAHTSLPARFCVVDGKETLFMLTHDEDIHPSHDAAILVKSEIFSSALETMFRATFEKR